MKSAKDLDVFISGETIDLCVPTNDDWVIEKWYKWFNDPTVTTYLNQGLFPNTSEKQKEFLSSCQQSNNRIVLLVKPKSQNEIIGVVSLSFIDFTLRQCDTALVIGEKIDQADALFYGFEAKALVTQHAFETLGMERVNSSQAINLIKWQRLQILFGFQIEGIMRKKFRKGINVYDTMVSSCLVEDYEKVLESRESYWPGKKEFFKLMKTVPKETPIDRLNGWLTQEHQTIWKEIFHAGN